MASKVLLVAYDNGSFTPMLPIGLSYIAAALRNAGHHITIYQQDIEHSPDEKLTEYLDQNEFDFVGVGVIGGYYQYRKLLSLSEAINRSRKRPYYMLGGHGPTPEPEYFLKKTQADAIVMGEGEITVVDLLDAIETKRPLSSVKGIAYRDGSKIHVTPSRPLITDLETIAWPAYDLFPIEVYRLFRLPRTVNTDFTLPILSGRGCTFRCTFCYRMDTGHRARKHEAILDEIELVQKSYGITYIDFEDELLVTSVQRTTEFCEMVLSRNMKFKWTCNGRLNYAKPNLLALMKRAGCVFINYGIESMDDTVLKNMKKSLRVDQIIPGVENTLAAGISPGLNMLFGNVGDNLETLNKAVDFLLKYDDHAQMRTIRPVAPYPGSPLYYYAIEKGLLKDCEDFYENKHKNSDLISVNFTELTDEEFYRGLYEANSRLISCYHQKSQDRYMTQLSKLYLEKDASFRGFRPV